MKKIELDNGKLIVNEKFLELLKLNNLVTADRLWNKEGEDVKKQRKERGTERIILKDPKTNVNLETYIKRYKPLPLKEYFKSITSFRPIHAKGAYHEWDAILLFHENDLPTMDPIAVAETEHGTCNLTLGITDYTRASEIFVDLKKNPNPERKKKLIEKIALLAKEMHNKGFGHQDFYLVHMFIKEQNEDEIFLIDLQRLIIQKKLSKRWRVKDLAQLYYSAAPFVDDEDIDMFWEIYSDGLHNSESLLSAITKKMQKIKRHDEKNYG
jgi:heptose I phosphotransferase